MNRKTGVILPLTMILLLTVSILAISMLSRSSATAKILVEKISKSELQMNAGNIFLANLAYIQEKYLEHGALLIDEYTEYTKLFSAPYWYTNFLSSFNEATLEGQGWTEFFGMFYEDRFYIPGDDLRKVFQKLAEGKNIDLVMIPHKKFPSSLLTIVQVEYHGIKGYCWGVVSPRYFSNWSRFELESNTTAYWSPGSIITGPTFFGSAGLGGAGNGGLRISAIVPPDPDNVSEYGPIFNGESWYESWNMNLSLNPDLSERRRIFVDQDNDGDYETNLGIKTYAIYEDGSRKWIYLSDFTQVIVATDYKTENGNLKVKGEIKDFIPHGVSGDFSAEFLPWYLPSGARKVDQESIEQLETRFNEIADYYDTQYGNVSPLEDILTTSYFATQTMLQAVNSFGIHFKDTERNLGSGDKTVVESDIQNITRQLDETNVINDIIDDVREWIDSDEKLRESVNYDLGYPINSRSFLSDGDIEYWLENFVLIELSTPEVIVEQKKIITERQTTGSVTIVDFASNVSISGDVVTGNTLKTILQRDDIPLNLSEKYSVLEFSWPREVRIGNGGTIRERYRIATRKALSYSKAPVDVNLIYHGQTIRRIWWWIWWKPKIWTKTGLTAYVPSEVDSWSDWSYSGWSGWETIAGGRGRGHTHTYTADVDFYLITDPGNFDNINFSSIAVYKVDSDDEGAYPSFTSTPVEVVHRGLMVVEDNVEIGGAGITGGIGKNLGREATVIDGKFTILSREGDISTNGDIVYNDMLNDPTFRNYFITPGRPFNPDYDPNDAVNNTQTDDMLNLVVADGTIKLPYHNTREWYNKVKNIKITANLFAFGKGSRGQIIIEGYQRYAENMGYRHLFGTMVDRDSGAAGIIDRWGNITGFRSRNYYDERLYGNEDMPFATPESNLIRATGISFK
ncbi:hypothetical protein [Kosmotoga olearia]|uniref:Uncharacterized protein n=1 Tax=Kosmotoga olearia (strain ATCC BAA-1733 / DSM 21960 / TBF 19.5.1) TaxID=521045 RepID=C5CE89_KOSOT|nr:hypothetical protein [Kosmotoga olearia]ACR79197.1 hypothetical protein Kole_0474 [Kosmotoga olearia TBF 19.5.1]